MNYIDGILILVCILSMATVVAVFCAYRKSMQQLLDGLVRTRILPGEYASHMRADKYGETPEDDAFDGDVFEQRPGPASIYNL